MTGRSFAPVGFDFTLSALSFHFQHWPAAFLLVLSVDDTRVGSLYCPATAAFTERICSSNLKRGKGRASSAEAGGEKRKTCCLGVRHNGGCGDRTPASRVWRRPGTTFPNTRALSS